VKVVADDDDDQFQEARAGDIYTRQEGAMPTADEKERAGGIQELLFIWG
jgi:hypothetical protein